jgi:hypothetical protein
MTIEEEVEVMRTLRKTECEFCKIELAPSKKIWTKHIDFPDKIFGPYCSLDHSGEDMDKYIGVKSSENEK